MMKYFKTIENSDFHKALKKNERQNKDWNVVSDFVSELLDEPDLKGVYCSHKLMVDVYELNDENKKLFKQNGEIKLNTKIGKSLNAKCKEKIKELGLDDYKTLSTIFFTYGYLRDHRSQTQNQFQTENLIIYIESNAPWTEREYITQLEEITEAEYYQARAELAEQKENK